MSNDVAFVISVSGAAVTPLEQVNHEMENTFRQAGLDDSGVAAGMRLQNLAGQYVRTGDWTTYKNNLQAAMASPLRPIAENFPQTQDSWVWAWWEKIGAYDPIIYWKLLKQPALILFGEEDEFDNVPVKESIVRLENSFKGIKKDITIRVYPGSGHGLFEPGTETRRLREEAFQLLTSWILKRTIRR
jgi:pimeloyl-ACP methyl ester carboxylesterase